jgi:hypothetical protein
MLAAAVIAICMAAATGVAWQTSSGARAQPGGALGGRALLFGGLVIAAFVFYLVALCLLTRIGCGVRWVAVIAVAIQFVPLGAPLLLSTDAWSYWDYGRIAAVHGANPYRDPPRAFPRDPAFGAMGADWRDRTTVYGPAFTLASEPIAVAAGRSPAAAAWVFRTLAAIATLAAAGLAARLTRRRALALAFVGWNPVLALHAAGGGHNDAWVGVAVLAAVALADVGYRGRSGLLWALAVLLKWFPLLLLAVHLVARRRRRLSPSLGAFAGAVALIGAAATFRYGLDWLAAVRPLARNAGRETSYALPHRLQSLGLPHAVSLAVAGAILAVAFFGLLRQAWHGHERLAMTGVAVLVTTPYLAVWYLGWAVPLAAAAEDDTVARLALLALCAYLLPQTIPF